jgi:hypothetical protein
MRVFGRETDRPHAAIALVCDELLHSASLNDCAFAWNVIYDHRVNEEWGDHWYREYGQPRSPGALRQSLLDYYNDLLEKPLRIYADIDAIARNFVRFSLPGGVEPGDSLVHVMDLWSPGARRIWAHGGRQEIGVLGEIPGIDEDAASPPSEIESILRTADAGAQTDLMEAFFAAQRDYLAQVDRARRFGRRMATLGYCWVGLWDQWAPTVGRAANDWCECVGLSKSAARTPAWIAVLRYTARRARRLMLPTQLEAQWYGRHFPTPPACPHHTGGRVIEGRQDISSDSARFALKEYIHAPIPFELENWLAAGYPVLPTARPVGDVTDLERDRSFHWDALVREFGAVGDWMPAPNASNISLAI